MRNACEGAPHLNFYKPCGMLYHSQQSLPNQCCEDETMPLVVKRQIFLSPSWHEAGNCQKKVAGGIPRDRAWAMGWAEEQLPSHYFIVVWLPGTLADM